MPTETTTIDEEFEARNERLRRLVSLATAVRDGLRGWRDAGGQGAGLETCTTQDTAGSV